MANNVGGGGAPAAAAAVLPHDKSKCNACCRIAAVESARTPIRATDLVPMQCACPRCRRLCLGLPGRTCPENVQQMLSHVCDIEELVPKLAIEVDQPSARTTPVRVLRPRTVEECTTVGLGPVFARAGACVFLDPESGCTLPRCAVPTTCRLLASCRPQLQRQAAERYGEQLRSVSVDAWRTGRGRRLMARFEQAVLRVKSDAMVSVETFQQRLVAIGNPVGAFALAMHTVAVNCANGTGEGYADSAHAFHQLSASVRSASASGNLALFGGWYVLYKADIEWACEKIESEGYTGMFQRIYTALKEGAPPPPLVEEVREEEEEAPVVSPSEVED